MKNWVQFCLKFFEENPGTPIVLHTLPPKPETTVDTTEPPAADDAGETGDPESDEPSDKLSNEPISSKKSTGPQAKSPHSTSNIPRLISVSEIIKREYFRNLPPESTGLYQYNHLGYLEEDDAALSNPNTLDENDRVEYITAVLEGKNFLKQQRTPYMSITLSTTALPELEGTRTRQDPQIKKRTRSAKARLKRRLKKEKEGLLESSQNPETVEDAPMTM